VAAVATHNWYGINNAKIPGDDLYAITKRGIVNTATKVNAVEAAVKLCGR
jgi:hypothetical protein